MPGEAQEPPVPPPLSSVFVSYASGDRAAARALRDTLAAAGLDVWFDENELGGGEAWDAKIRNQIRACTYFMPVISATTEIRREGYFRREWRLAVDRSHDMADDAMFLLPVVIDDTPQAGARVPEKFLTVQWLKAPGGQATPALAALAARLARGEHVAPIAARPGYVPPPPARSTPVPPPLPPPAPAVTTGLPPIAPFPTRPPGSHDNLKHLADILVWFGTTLWLLFKRLPRWGRILVLIWIIMMAFTRSCTTSEDKKAARAVDAQPAKADAASDDKDAQEAAAALAAAAKKLDQVAADPTSQNLKAGFARAGAELARTVSKQFNPGDATNLKIAVIPFTAPAADAADRKFGELVVAQVFAQLTLARPDHVKMRPADNPAADEPTLRALASQAGEDRVLLARLEGGDLVVRLVGTATPDVIWTGHYPVAGGDVSSIAAQIVQGVLAEVPSPAPAKP